MSTAAFSGAFRVLQERGFPAAARRALPLLAAASLAALAGCANTDSVTVGSIPDDYRTNHPIVVGEKNLVLDLPVGQNAFRITRSQKDAIAGFLADYKASEGSFVTILVPSGSANGGAASAVAGDFAKELRANGVPAGRVLVQSYHAQAAEASAPIRITYSAIKASTGKCGRWPADIADTTDNKHYANFGCSYQNNLAAQIANPADLLGPRKQTEIDAEKRIKAIDTYRKEDSAPPDTWVPETDIDF